MHDQASSAEFISAIYRIVLFRLYFTTSFATSVLTDLTKPALQYPLRHDIAISIFFFIYLDLK